jgi:sarcosine oxidase
VHRKYPGYWLPDHYGAVYQREGCFLLSEKCIDTYVDLASHKYGADVKNERMVSWGRRDKKEFDGTPKPLRVETSRGVYYSSKLILTVGSWASLHIGALSRNARCTPERQVVGWFQPLEGKAGVFGGENEANGRTTVNREFPVFNLQGDNRNGDGHSRYYGFPMHDVNWNGRVESFGFKIGRYHHLEESHQDPEFLRSPPGPRDEALLRKAIHEFFPLANGRLQQMKTCLFTNSSDKHFIIDKAPLCPSAVFAAGFSGHGFKFCSVVGEILKELVTDGGESSERAKFLGLDRFVT